MLVAGKLTTGKNYGQEIELASRAGESVKMADGNLSENEYVRFANGKDSPSGALKGTSHGRNTVKPLDKDDTGMELSTSGKKTEGTERTPHAENVITREGY